MRRQRWHDDERCKRIEQTEHADSQRNTNDAPSKFFVEKSKNRQASEVNNAADLRRQSEQKDGGDAAEYWEKLFSQCCQIHFYYAV